MKTRRKITTLLFITFTVLTSLFGKTVLLKIYGYFAFIPRVKLTLNEKVFIDSLKKTLNCYTVYRTPEFKPDYYEKNNEYGIVAEFRGFPVLKNKRDSLSRVSFRIAQKAYMEINKKDTSIFTSYRVTFWGKEEIFFLYRAKEL